MNTAPFADVIIDIAHEQVDRPFQYKIPEALTGRIEPGTPVTVPFGRGNGTRLGFVVALSDKPDIEPDRIKEIAGIAEEERETDAVRIRLAAWMKERYGGTLIQSLKTVLPAHKKAKKLRRRFVTLCVPKEEATAFLNECLTKRHVARARLTEALLEAPDDTLPYTMVTGKLHVTGSVVKGLVERGIVTVRDETSWRDPAAKSMAKQKDTPEAALTLSEEQEHIVRDVMRAFDAGDYTPSLIHGVTGSGKTEVYIRLIEETVKRGRQAIVLIPEIALTYQTLMRFYKRFSSRVSVLNSSLTPEERFDQLERAAEGEIDVMIGPRSALFTPFARLGLIVIDEEHELSYKSETMPKYHARETAIALASFVKEGCTVVMGSATPSLEAYAGARQGTFRLYPLTRRLTGGTLARVHIVDLRDELRAGNRSVFSVTLQEMMRQRLQNGEQIMLFLNRRGLAGFVSCRSCGHTMKCPHCDVSLSSHRGGVLMCHYCGHTERMVEMCPSCSSPYISAFRAGTQQIEDGVKKLFPKARVLRMDADTTKSKYSYETILSSFANMGADVLVGTQMIVKGHDFPNVTLVGVLAADMSLNIADFRAAERTFQLLTQAAGRAGRGEKEGDVVIQTYQPSHYAITGSARQDYPAFFEEEMGYRKLLRYPPAAHLMAVQVFADDAQTGMETADRLKACMERFSTEETLITGPAPALVAKVDDRYRFVVYVKDGCPENLTKFREACEETIRPGRGVQIQFDTDPVRGF